jgi:protein-S-isoprenylcysteine O-methyltransferase Ste14
MNPLLKILPPIWYLLFLGAALVAHFYFPASHVFDFSDSIWFAVVGGAVFLGSFALTLNASRIFAIEKTEILPTSETNKTLVTYGPYKRTRNPMYLGMVLSLIGVAIWLGTLPMFLAAFADFLVLNFVFIPFEEAKMARQFGASFEAYKKSVRRWI